MVKNQSQHTVYKEPSPCTIRTSIQQQSQQESHNITTQRSPQHRTSKNYKKKKVWEEQSNLEKENMEKEKQRVGKSVIAGMHQ